MSLTKDQVTQWFHNIRFGDLYCPFEECTWTFFTSFELADHLLEDCEYGRYTDNVPCTHCSEELKAEDLKHHWQMEHKDEATILNLLDKGLQSTCPNYLCSKLFDGNFDGCKEYTKHSIMCRPLFRCHKCKGEYISKVTLQQHICKGELKKEGTCVSKAEVIVDRDTNKRPCLSVEEELLHIEEWKKAIKSANFSCPVPSCTKQFFVLNHFTQHLTMEAKLDDIFNKIDMVECPFCVSIINWLQLGRHINDYHKDVSKMLNMLRNGTEMTCPNYKCTSKEVFTCNTGIEYLKHAVTCRPRYQCVYCGTETKRESALKRHLLTCKREVKEEGSEHGVDDCSPQANINKRLQHVSDTSSEAFIKRRKNCVGKIIKKYNIIQSKVKKVGFGRQANINAKMRKNMALRKRKPNILKDKYKSEEVDDKLYFQKINNNVLKQNEMSTKKHSRLTSSLSGSPELQSTNKDLDISFTDEMFEMDSSTEKPSPRTVYRKSYLRHTIKKKVLKTMFDSSSEISEPKKCLEKGMQNEKLLVEWKSQLANGIFTCGNCECSEAFSLPENMIEHMQKCNISDTNDYILQADLMNCLWCKQDIRIKSFKDHADQQHSMIMETLCSTTANYMCPNYDCNTIFDGVEEFLHHSVECPTCIVCVDCKLTFISEEDNNNHDCMANDEMFRKRSLNMWRNQIRSGHLQCPNISCSSKYFYYEEFVKHIQICAKKSRFCKYAVSENEMPCSYCAATLSCDEYGKHFAHEHLEILRELQKVESGKTVRCLNYKCKRMFDDPFKYFHHLSVCRPLYLCTMCTKEFNGHKSYSSHPCVESGSMPLEVEGDSTHGGSELDGMWYEDLKNAIYKCPSKECGKAFKTFEGLIPHLKSCKKGKACQLVLQKDVFVCCCCKEEFSVDGFISHFTESHKQIMMQLFKMENTSSSRCLNKTCKKVFVDRGKLLQHNIECLKNSCKSCGETCKNFSTCYRSTIRKKPSFNLKSWHEEIKNGVMSCPNSCSMVFNDLGCFIDHLRHCQHRNIASKAVLIPLPCLICKSTYPVADIYEHFKSAHTLVFAQLKLIEQGVCIHCANNDCKEPFTDSTLYLQHVATTCQLSFHCEFCTNYFQSQDLLDAHQCLEKESSGASEESIRGTSQSTWYGKIMKGDLRCPNSNCGVEFVLPRNFIDHIRMCREGQEYVSVLNRQELPCCFCKTYVPLGDYCTHLSSCHKKGSSSNIKVTCDQTGVSSKKAEDRRIKKGKHSHTGVKTQRAEGKNIPSGRKPVATPSPVRGATKAFSSGKQLHDITTSESISQRDGESAEIAGNCRSISDMLVNLSTGDKDKQKYIEDMPRTSCDTIQPTDFLEDLICDHQVLGDVERSSSNDEIDFNKASRELKGQKITKGNMDMNVVVKLTPLSDGEKLLYKNMSDKNAAECRSEITEEEPDVTIKAVQLPINQVLGTPNNSDCIFSPVSDVGSSISNQMTNLKEKIEMMMTPTLERTILDDRHIKLLVKSLLKKKKRKSKQLRRSETLPVWTVTEKPKQRKEESVNDGQLYGLTSKVVSDKKLEKVFVGKSDANTNTEGDVLQERKYIDDNRNNRDNRDAASDITRKQKVEEKDIEDNQDFSISISSIMSHNINASRGDESTREVSDEASMKESESEKGIQGKMIGVSEIVGKDTEAIQELSADMDKLTTDIKKSNSDICSAEISEADCSGLSQTDDDNEEVFSKSKSLPSQNILYRSKKIKSRVKFNESDSSQNCGTDLSLNRRHRRSKRPQEDDKQMKKNVLYTPRVEKKYSLRSSSGDEDFSEHSDKYKENREVARLSSDRDTLESSEETNSQRSTMDPKEEFLGALKLSKKGEQQYNNKDNSVFKGRQFSKRSKRLRQGVDRKCVQDNFVIGMEESVCSYNESISRYDSVSHIENKNDGNSPLTSSDTTSNVAEDISKNIINKLEITDITKEAAKIDCEAEGLIETINEDMKTDHGQVSITDMNFDKLKGEITSERESDIDLRETSGSGNECNKDTVTTTFAYSNKDNMLFTNFKEECENQLTNIPEKDLISNTVINDISGTIVNAEVDICEEGISLKGANDVTIPNLGLEPCEAASEFVSDDTNVVDSQEECRETPDVPNITLENNIPENESISALLEERFDDQKGSCVDEIAPSSPSHIPSEDFNAGLGFVDSFIFNEEERYLPSDIKKTLRSQILGDALLKQDFVSAASQEDTLCEKDHDSVTSCSNKKEEVLSKYDKRMDISCIQESRHREVVKGDKGISTDSDIISDAAVETFPRVESCGESSKDKGKEINDNLDIQGLHAVTESEHPHSSESQNDNDHNLLDTSTTGDGIIIDDTPLTGELETEEVDNFTYIPITKEILEICQSSAKVTVEKIPICTTNDDLSSYGASGGGSICTEELLRDDDISGSTKDEGTELLNEDSAKDEGTELLNEDIDVPVSLSCSDVKCETSAPILYKQPELCDRKMFSDLDESKEAEDQQSPVVLDGSNRGRGEKVNDKNLSKKRIIPKYVEQGIQKVASWLDIKARISCVDNKSTQEKQNTAVESLFKLGGHVQSDDKVSEMNKIEHFRSPVIEEGKHLSKTKGVLEKGRIEGELFNIQSSVPESKMSKHATDDYIQNQFLLNEERVDLGSPHTSDENKNLSKKQHIPSGREGVEEELFKIQSDTTNTTSTDQYLLGQVTLKEGSKNLCETEGILENEGIDRELFNNLSFVSESKMTKHVTDDYLQNRSAQKENEESDMPPVVDENINFSKGQDILDKEGIEKELFNIQSTVSEGKTSQNATDRYVKNQLTLREDSLKKSILPLATGVDMDVSEKEGIESELFNIQSTVSETKMEQQDGVQSQIPLKDGDQREETDSLISTQDSIQENISESEEPHKAKVSRRFKYGKLSTFNKKKVGKIEKQRPVPKLPAKLSCIKVSDVHSEQTKPVDADILKLMSLNNQNLKTQDDKSDLLKVKPAVSSCVTSTSNRVEAVNQLLQIPASNVNTVKSPEQKGRENFIDFKIEPSDYMPEETVESDVSQCEQSEPIVITYDSHKGLDGVDDNWKEEVPSQRQRHFSNTLADTDSSLEMPSPSYHAKPSDIPPSAEGPQPSPLKEMLFLIPKDGFDVHESLGESDVGTPYKLPGLSNISGMHSKKFPLHHKVKSPKVSMQKYAKLSQMEETQVIENELQDLLSTLPSNAQSPKSCIQLWKARLFSYSMYCQFVECQRSFSDPASLIDHMRMCKDTSENNQVIWKMMVDVIAVCPECNKTIRVDAYDMHYMEKHPVLLDMLKELGEQKRVKCKNYRCKAEPTTPIDCVNHFNQCGVAVKSAKTKFCEKCSCVFKTKKALLTHVCDMQQALDDVGMEKSISDVRMALTASVITQTNKSEDTSKCPLELLSNTEVDISKNEQTELSCESEGLLKGSPISNLVDVVVSDSMNSSVAVDKSNEDITGIKNVATVGDLSTKQTTENLKILQDICENILTQSGQNLKTDVIADETTDIIASLEDLKKNVASVNKLQHPSQRLKKMREDALSSDNSNSIHSSDTDSNEPVRKAVYRKHLGERSRDDVDGIGLHKDNVSADLPPCSPSKKKKRKSKLNTSIASNSVDDTLQSGEVKGTVGDTSADLPPCSPSQKKKRKPKLNTSIASNSVDDTLQSGEVKGTVGDTSSTEVRKKYPLKKKSFVLSDAATTKKSKSKRNDPLGLSRLTKKAASDISATSVDINQESKSNIPKSVSDINSIPEHSKKTKGRKKKVKSEDVLSDGLSVKSKHSLNELQVHSNSVEKSINDNTGISMVETLESFNAIQAQSFSPLLTYSKHLPYSNSPADVSMNLTNLSLSAAELSSECETPVKKPRKNKINSSSQPVIPVIPQSESDASVNDKNVPTNESEISVKKETPRKRGRPSLKSKVAGVSVSEHNTLSECETLSKKPRKELPIPSTQPALPPNEPTDLLGEKIVPPNEPGKSSETLSTKKARKSRKSSQPTLPSGDSGSSISEQKPGEIPESGALPKKKGRKKSVLPQSEHNPSLSEEIIPPDSSIGEDIIPSASSLSEEVIPPDKASPKKERKKTRQSSTKLDLPPSEKTISTNKPKICETNTSPRKGRKKRSFTNPVSELSEVNVKDHDQIDKTVPPTDLLTKEQSGLETPSDSSPHKTSGEEQGEQLKEEEDLASPPIWLSYAVNYNYYCPTEDCWAPFYLGSTMVYHMRRCVRKCANYVNMKLTCPECNLSTNVKEFSKHLKTKHLLLHWYLEELERGNWVICQNYKCAKYMEDITECVEHFRRCDYLWKCKYCDIEYTREKDVERHHCRTTSEAESEYEDEADTRSSGNTSESNKKQEHTGDQNKDGCSIDNKENKGVACKNIQNTDNNTCSVKVELSNSAHECATGENLDENINTKTKLQQRLKKANSKGTRKKTSKIEEAALKVKGKEIEKIIKNIKENRKKSRSLSEMALMQWQENFKKFNFSCPMEGCDYTSYFPTYTHVKTCDLFEDEIQRSTVLKQIESLKFECAFDFCKQKDKSLPSLEYARHLLSSHKMLLIYLKALRAEEKVTCLNFKCAKEITSIDEAVFHYVSCRFLWKCELCLVEYKTESSVKTHTCGETDEVEDIKKEEEPAEENDGKRKRKSAARSSKQENPELTSMTQISS